MHVAEVPRKAKTRLPEYKFSSYNAQEAAHTTFTFATRWPGLRAAALALALAPLGGPWSCSSRPLAGQGQPRVTPGGGQQREREGENRGRSHVVQFMPYENALPLLRVWLHVRQYR